MAEFKTKINLKKIEFKKGIVGSYGEYEKAIDTNINDLKENTQKIKDDLYSKMFIVEDKNGNFNKCVDILVKIEKLKAVGGDSLFLLSIFDKEDEIIRDTKIYENLKKDLMELNEKAKSNYDKIIAINSQTMIYRDLTKFNEEVRQEFQRNFYYDLTEINASNTYIIEEMEKQKIHSKINDIYSKEAYIIKLGKKIEDLEV